MLFSLLIAALAAVSVAIPHQPRSQKQKRSFHAGSHGRGLTPQQEILRTHRKFGWDIIVANVPSVVTSTVIVTPAATSTTYAPTVYGTPSPTWDNTSMTSTASGASSTSTDGAGSEDGEVTATPEPDESEYLSPVTVGGQKLTLNFDTGSADL